MKSGVGDLLFDCKVYQLTPLPVLLDPQGLFTDLSGLFCT